MKYTYIILLSIFFLVSCGKDKDVETTDNTKVTVNTVTVTKDQFQNENMELGSLTNEAFNEMVRTNGMTDVPPNNKASIRTFMGGYIKNTPLLIGDKVKKGQLLVTLQNTDYVEAQQQYVEVAEQLNYLKSEYERQKTLYNEKISSEKNFLKAESTYKSTLAMYNGLQKKLRMINIDPVSVEQGNITSTIHIYSPIAGSITKVNVSNGSYVSPADEIMEVVNTSHIHLELSVFEKDILKIKKGQKVLFKIPEASDKMYEAEVHLVGTSVDAKDRTITVHAHIEDDEQLRFVTGMFVEAQIIVATQESLALPKDAVIEIDGDYFTLVLKEEKNSNYIFNKVKLEIGKQTEKYIQILNTDVLKDKKILTKGAFMVMTE